MLFDQKKLRLPDSEDALEGRKTPMEVPNRHFVNGREILPPFPAHLERAVFGMGCFWGAEKTFWVLPGAYTTAVGYSGGLTPNPTYKEVCTGRTGHAEAVEVTFDPAVITYEKLIEAFFAMHDAGRGGGQYGSAIFCHAPGQKEQAEAVIARLKKQGRRVGTVLAPAATFWRAEECHQRHYEKTRRR